MPEIPKGVRDNVSWLLLDDLDNNGEGLTKWEVDFVEGLKSQLLQGRILTRPQSVRLREIMESRLP